MSKQSNLQSNSDLFDECLRLDDEIGRLTTDLESIETNVEALLGSATWRFCLKLYHILRWLRVVPSRRTAWESITDQLSRRAPQSAAHEVLVEGLHAQQATTAAGLTKNGKALLNGAFGAFVAPATLRKPQKMLIRSGNPLYKTCSDSAYDAALCGEGYRKEPLVGLFKIGSRRATGITRLAPTQSKVRSLHIWTIANELGWHRYLINIAMIGRGRNLGVPFVEANYIRQNRDLEIHLSQGRISSGKAHWHTFGRESFFRGNRRFQPLIASSDKGLRELSDELQTEADEEISSWRQQPLISLIMPIFQVDLRWLKAAVESVQRQAYPHWELCLVDDGSKSGQINNYLKTLSDPRIDVRLLEDNIGIAGASNIAMESATGSYIALIDHDDELTVDALWLVARVIVEHCPDLIYSDEAKLTLSGEVIEAHFKPDFSPETIQSQNYISHLGVYRKSILDEIGGFRPGYEGSQDHDLLLRFLEKAKSVFHIPRILYYWRKIPGSTAARFGHKNYAWDAGVRAVASLQETLDTGATVEKGEFPGTYRVVHPIRKKPKISILIPFRDKAELLDQCFSSILERTMYQHFEILGINNDSRENATQDAMRRWQRADGRIRFADYAQEFNYAAINNFAVQQVDGDHIVLLNNDVSVIDDYWLTALLEYSQQPKIGAVGGKLLYPDGTIQHAGIILGIGGVAGHSHKYFKNSLSGYFSRPHIVQNVSAVTGACLMVKRDLYLQAGGLEEEHLKVAFNDVDFCLRLGELGFRNIYTPYCILCHHESKSRGQEDTLDKQRRFATETRYMRWRHVRRLSLGDPYYNPNLTLERENFAIRER